MKHVFIINPLAGKKDSCSRIFAMADTLRRAHGLDVSCLLTESRGHATALARSFAESGEAVRLYACGGDGTVNEVANGVAGYENAAMTCIPIGTGNDFLKNFGEDCLTQFADAENLWDGEVQQLDLIDCNGRMCLTIACNGIDARTCESVHDFHGRHLSGRSCYLASAAVNFLFRDIAQHWTVTLDGQTIEEDFTLASLCNGRYYGGGIMPVPEARMNDGKLQAVLVRKMGRAAFAALFPAYSSGNYRKISPSLLRVVTAECMTIRSEEEITTCLDGECFRSHEVTMRLADRKLNFFGPRGCDPNATARG